MVPAGLPVVVRVKRKRNLEPVDTIVVEADETPAAKRRAHDAALAAELDAVLAGAMAGGAVTKQETDTSRAQGGAGADVSARAGEIAARPNRRRFRRVQMTLSVADASDDAVVRELARQIAAASSHSKKRNAPEVNDEPTLSSQGYVVASRLEASLAKSKKRATTLSRPAPRTADIGADAMEGHFRMFDLEAGVEGAGDESVLGTSGNSNKRNSEEATLMANYLPMVREFMGTSADAAGTRDATKAPNAEDEFVYDVYVQEEEEEMGNEGEGDRRDKEDDDETTKLIFAGGVDAAYFFDAMDGLGDETETDDDSQDSNREDGPGADYPEDEDSFDEDSSDEESEDGWGRQRRQQVTTGDGFGETAGGGFGHTAGGGGFGFWPGFGRGVLGANDGGDDGSDGYDVDEGDDGFATARAAGTFRETAYDPQFDDVGGEETYY